MKHFLLKLEPVIWLLFGLGILLGTMLLTGWLVVFGVGLTANALLDFQVIPAYAWYEQAYALASNPIGRLVLLALAALPLWKGAHHLRSLNLDFGGADRDPAVATILYGIAAAGSLVAIYAVVRL